MISPRSARAHRADIALYGLLVGAAVVLGAAVVDAPRATFGIVIFAAVGFTVLRLPTTAFVAAVIALQAFLGILVRDPSGARLVDYIGGPARGSALLAVLIAARILWRRRRLELPREVLVVVASAALLIAYQVAVLRVRGTDLSRGIAQLYADAPASSPLPVAFRSALFPLAAFVGALAFTGADARGRRALARSVVVVAIASFGLSIAYVLSIRGLPLPPPLGGLFTRIESASGYDQRSIVPFSSDSPNGNAVALVVLGALATSLVLQYGERRDRRVLPVLLVLCLAAVLSCQSRTGLISFTASFATVVTLRARRNALLVAMGGLVIAIAIAFGASQLLPEDRGVSATTPTLVARQELWGRAWKTFRDAPVFGEGYAFSGSAVFSAPPLPGDRTASATKQIAPAIAGTQSEYLAQLVDGGTVGVLLFLAPFALVVGVGVRRRAAGQPEDLSILAACLVPIAVAAFSTTVHSAPANWTFVWLVIGLVLMPKDSEEKR